VLEAGAHWVEDIKDLASRVDILCTMVGYPEDVESVVLGEKGALASMNPGSLLIDFTTSSPDLAERIAQKASVSTVLSLDAPVSGGDIGAKEAHWRSCVGEKRKLLPGQNQFFNAWVIKLSILVGRGQGNG
jgi:3-hydroxyisobutyrate dehydrogenase-like beta-hydroxyacid dehydrogenase